MSEAPDLFVADEPRIVRRATISADNLYRYRLTRIWEPGKPPLSFVMLNPSTADDRVDDPTIRRCMAFARREGCGGIIVANLYGLRATDPSELLRAADPFGPKNGAALLSVLDESVIYDKPVVCAWGTKGGRGAINFAISAKATLAKLMCLGQTKDGHPRHPLYVRGDQPFVEWRP